MSQSSNRATRSVQIADHLWDLFEQMAKAVGSDRDGLINQAMFMFARLNGFLGGVADTSSEDEPGYALTAPTPARPIDPGPPSSDDSAAGPQLTVDEATKPDAP